MQSSFWKLGALLGVIGVGFLVLMKAQTGMTTGKDEPVGKEFDETAAIEELDDLASPDMDTESAPSEETPSESPNLFALTDGEILPVGTDETADVEPTPAARIDPVPFQFDEAPRQTDTGEERGHSFATIMPASSGSAPPQSEPSSTEAVPDPFPAQQDEPNPFGALVNTIAEGLGAAVEPADHDSPQAVEATMADAAGTEVDTFNPFASQPDVTPESEQESVAPNSVATIFPQEEELEPTPETVSEAADASVPNPGDQFGPSIERPSSFDGLNEPSQPTLADTSLPAGNPELPTLAPFPIADSDQAVDENAVVQASAEIPADTGSEPNPFLVFPGAGDLDDGPDSHSPSPQPELVANQPAETRGAATTLPSGNEPADPSEPRGVVFPDGTIEMTIKPRDEPGQPILPAQQTEQVASPAPESFLPLTADVESPPIANDDPFAAGGEVRPQMPLGDLGQPFTSQPDQPPANQRPELDTPMPHSLTPSDYVGVGTVSEETPSTPQQAQLTIQKQAPGDAVLGQDLIYSILVKNIGRSPAKNVVVEDLVPKGSELKGTDPQAQMTPEKKLVWQLGTMAPGTEKKIRIKVVPVEAGQIGSVATVAFEAAVASRTIITAPELRLQMQGPREVRLGEQAPFVFTLSNVGTADASNVFIRSILPSGFRHPAANEKNDIEYEVGSLTRGQSRQVELTLLAVAPGDFQNRAILSADGNVSVESRQPVKVISSRLKMTREGPTSRFVGREARYTSTLTNESSETLTGLTITETVPSGFQFVSASDNGSFSAERRTVTWRVNTLAPGGALRFQTVCLADQPGRLESTIQAQDQRGDQAEAVSQTTVAGFSSLTVDVANPGRPIPVGEELALRLKVRNGGTAAANQVQTSVELPPELRFISARGPVSYSQDGQRIVFQAIDQIDVKSEQTFDVVFAAAQATEDARVVVQLSSSELAKPLSEEESVVIFAEGE